MRTRCLLLILFSALSAFAQTPTSIGQPNMAARRQRDLESGRRQARHDSLEWVFYQEPPYVVVSYYENLCQLPWSATMSFYVEKDHKEMVLSPSSGNQFLLPPLNGDSVVLGVRYRGRKIVFGKIPVRDFAHGATVAFGYITRAHMKVKPDEETYPSNEAPPYQVLSHLDLAQWHCAKKVVGVQYCVIYPRVYGDGTVITIHRPYYR